eukprot:6306425-Amphidinium_carterae.1
MSFLFPRVALRWMEQWKGREIFDAVRAGSQKLEHFVTKDEASSTLSQAHSGSSDGCHDLIQALFGKTHYGCSEKETSLGTTGARASLHSPCQQRGATSQDFHCFCSPNYMQNTCSFRCPPRLQQTCCIALWHHDLFRFPHKSAIGEPHSI